MRLPFCSFRSTLINGVGRAGTRFLAWNTCGSNIVSATRHGSSCLGKSNTTLLPMYLSNRNLVSHTRSGHTKIAGTDEATGSTLPEQFKHPYHKYWADIVFDTVNRRRTNRQRLLWIIDRFHRDICIRGPWRFAREWFEEKAQVSRSERAPPSCTDQL